MNRLLLLAVTLFVPPLAAQAPGAFSAPEFPPYRVYPGVLDEDDHPVSEARLCLTQEKPQCYTLPRKALNAGKDDWFYFGLRAHSERLKLEGGGSLVLFNANCGGGSGSSDRYAMLRLDPKRGLVNLLPEVIVSNQADVAAWDLPEVSSAHVFVTADFLWEGMEAHYSDHHFEIRAYVYDAAKDRYTLRHKYRTTQLYPGLDNWEQRPAVLQSERSKILQLLQRP